MTKCSMIAIQANPNDHYGTAWCETHQMAPTNKGMCPVGLAIESIDARVREIVKEELLKHRVLVECHD